MVGLSLFDVFYSYFYNSDDFKINAVMAVKVSSIFSLIVRNMLLSIFLSENGCFCWSPNIRRIKSAIFWLEEQSSNHQVTEKPYYNHLFLLLLFNY